MVGAKCAFSPKLTGRFGCRYGSVDCNRKDLAFERGYAGVFFGFCPSSTQNGTTQHRIHALSVIRA